MEQLIVSSYGTLSRDHSLKMVHDGYMSIIAKEDTSSHSGPSFDG